MRPETVLEEAGASGRVLIRGATWDFYEQLLEQIDDAHYFVTYDDGELEIMVPSILHDLGKGLLTRLIESMALELDIEIATTGETTWRRKSVGKGLEADESYYIANAPAVLGAQEADLERLPPPDLAIEVDVSRDWRRREAVYAGLVVPEVWRLKTNAVTFHRLNSGRKYKETQTSLSFPFLSARDLSRFLAMRGEKSENQIIREFLAHLIPRAKAQRRQE
jgi:Uma2 family endonuclease